MKKFLITLLALSLLICSCTKDDKSPSATSGTTATTTAATTADPLDDTSYESIERIATASYTSGIYGAESDYTLINLSFPSQWTLVKNINAFDVVRDGKTVGIFCKGEPSDISDWTVLKTDADTFSGGNVEKIIERRGARPTSEYRYRYVYSFETEGTVRTFTLAVACAEIDAPTEAALISEASTTPRFQSPTVGMLSELKDIESILIVGNSFIGTSDIHATLEYMLTANSKQLTVDSESRGMAGVGTYMSDQNIMRDLRRGKYDALFICGFYSNTEADYLRSIKAACDESNTLLVIFPAHNELSSAVDYAMKKYSSVYLLNWQKEINNLIRATPLTRLDFCYNDSYAHSTPLAGYVGAHMIYRAIYGELPKRSSRLSSYENKLTDYIQTADIVEIDKNLVTYFE